MPPRKEQPVWSFTRPGNSGKVCCILSEHSMSSNAARVGVASCTRTRMGKNNYTVNGLSFRIRRYSPEHPPPHRVSMTTLPYLIRINFSSRIDGIRCHVQQDFSCVWGCLLKTKQWCLLAFITSSRTSDLTRASWARQLKDVGEVCVTPMRDIGCLAWVSHIHIAFGLRVRLL
jgi:hypothetical protein